MTQPKLSSLTLADVVRVPRPGLGGPSRIRFSPDGEGVMYLRSERADLVQSLWEWRLDSDEPQRLAGPPPGTGDESSLSLEEALRRERLRMRELGVTDYRVAHRADPPILLVPSPDGVRVRVGDGKFRLLEGTAGSQSPRLSPDGAWVAFVRDGEIHVLPASGGSTERLTSGAEPGLTYGLAEFIAQEEFDRGDGYWWSLDSRHIAFEEADSRHLPRFNIVHDEGPRQSVETHEYPFAGSENARVRI